MSSANSQAGSRHPVDIWDEVIGQARAVQVLQRAVADSGSSAMTHAWLITGPPGSGRSVAARAFAAALQCRESGCGSCQTCRTCLSGAHPDITLCRTEQLSIGVDEIRGLALKSAMSPVSGPWQVLVIEDADRVTDAGAAALLKCLEEPASRTIWVLCAPNADDLLATIRSRTREVRLVTPADNDVAQLLVSRDGVEPEMAMMAARAAQGHVGRARALARAPEVWESRQLIVELPERLTSLEACLSNAAAVIAQAQATASAQTASLDQEEREALELTLGLNSRGGRSRQGSAAMTKLEEDQKARAKRLQRDAIDHVLTELATWYRDRMSLQAGVAESKLINLSCGDRLQAAAQATTLEETTNCLEAILQARRAIDANVAPLLAIEALFVKLGQN